MNKIDISSNAAMARTLPPAGKTVMLYNHFNTPFVGKVELNQWFRPVFYMLVNDDWYRLNFVPSGWDELETNGTADEDAGTYGDMPTMKEAA